MKKLFVALIIFYIGFSCVRDNKREILETDIQEGEDNKNSGGIPTGEEIILGNKINNPFREANMRKALDTLMMISDTSITQEMKDKIKNLKIEVTDLYVRFLPQDSTDLERLKEDTTLFYFDYPLDYELKQLGNRYHDPSIPKDKITWKYAVIKKDKKFPNVKHEILEELVIPEHQQFYSVTEVDIPNNNKRSTDRINLFKLIEKISINITGNSDNPFERIPGGNQRAAVYEKRCFLWMCWHELRYKPDGWIMAKNDIRNRMEGVKGIKVWFRSWFYCYGTRTNSEGYYLIDEPFSSSGNYTIEFEGGNGDNLWSINDYAVLGTTNYTYWFKSPNGFNMSYEDGKGKELCNINNAAYEYMNLCDRLGIPRPPGTLVIWYMDWFTQGMSSAPLIRYTDSWFEWTKWYGIPASLIIAIFKPLLPDIILSEKYNSTKNIYSTMFHELSHASHFRNIWETQDHSAANKYWNEFRNFIMRSGMNDPYGKKSDRGSEYCETAEGWAYFIDKYLMKEYDPLNKDGFGYLDNILLQKKWLPSGFFDRLNKNVGMPIGLMSREMRYDNGSLKKYKDHILNKYYPNTATETKWIEYIRELYTPTNSLWPRPNAPTLENIQEGLEFVREFHTSISKKRSNYDYFTILDVKYIKYEIAPNNWDFILHYDIKCEFVRASESTNQKRDSIIVIYRKICEAQEKLQL